MYEYPPGSQAKVMGKNDKCPCRTIGTCWPSVGKHCGFILLLSSAQQSISTLLSPALANVPTCVWSCQNTYSGPGGARAWDLHPGFSLKWTHKGLQLFAAWPEPRGHCNMSQDSYCRAAVCLRVVPLLKFTHPPKKNPKTNNNNKNPTQNSPN